MELSRCPNKCHRLVLALMLSLAAFAAAGAPPAASPEACLDKSGECRLFRNEMLGREVNRVGQVLARQAVHAGVRFTFRVVDTDAMDAFANPDGEIRVTIGALNALRDEAELASVLAHEIAHVLVATRAAGIPFDAPGREAEVARETEVERETRVLLARAGYRPIALRELVPILLTHSVTGTQKMFPSHALWLGRPAVGGSGSTPAAEAPLFFFGS